MILLAASQPLVKMLHKASLRVPVMLSLVDLKVFPFRIPGEGPSAGLWRADPVEMMSTMRAMAPW